jgi:hypothetical protein
LDPSFITRGRKSQAVPRCSRHSLKEEADGYLHTESFPGAKIFALLPISQVAQACFGEDCWPKEIPAPQAWLEFDLKSVLGQQT